MKFFVSGKVGDEENVRNAIQELRNNGHQITFDWTQISHLRPYDQNVSHSREAAIKETEGVKSADVLVLLACKNGVGMYVELGMAIGLNIPIRIVTKEESRSMFFHHPLVKKVKGLAEIIEEFSS